MRDGLDLMLRGYLDEVRPRLPAGLALFPDQSGGRLHRGSVRNRLAHLLDLEAAPVAGRFSPHAMRRGCATHHYERRGHLVPIQPILGPWQIRPPVRYVPPSSTFIEDAYRPPVCTPPPPPANGD